MSSDPQSPNSKQESGAQRPQSFVIETFSLRFDFQEDRLRLDATDKAGRFQGLWLTQRLANKLIATLAKDLDREVKPPAQATQGAEAVGASKSQQTSNTEHEPRLKAALHEMAQQRMRTERARNREDINRSPVDNIRPVSLPASRACWLCTAIQLSPKPGGVLISFMSERCHGARFFMSYRNARRFLDGLAKHFRKANWPLKAFPDWVREASEITVEQGAQVRLN